MKRILLLMTVAFATAACGEKPIPDPVPGPGPAVEGFSIAGLNPADFTIVYNPDEEDNASYQAALDLRTALKSIGYVLNVAKSSTPVKEKEILVGNCGREGNKEYYSSARGDIFDWQISYENGKLMLQAQNSWGLKAAANTLRDSYIARKEPFSSESLSGNCRRTQVFELSAGTNLRIFDWNIWQYDATTIPAAFYSENGLLYDPRNANRAMDFGAVIKATAPDVFGLQEYSSKMNTEFIKYVTPQFAQVTTSSSSWSFTPLFYDPQKVSVKKAEYVLFPSPWSNSNSKSYTIALFNHKASMKDFIVVCTHLWWKSESAAAGSNQARLDQSNMILKKVQEWLISYDVPVFVMGDMNCNLSSDAMKAYINDGYKSAAQDAVNHKDGSRGYHACSESGFAPETADQADPTKNGTTAIDHIWFKNCGTTATVRDYWIVHTRFTLPMSDHAPRFIDVSMK
ncbi:MAG: endonuclease/exonuclease/phosphatase family protein [Bacteroidales bacterium]|nr:endonuclease/exonuclease/phosphatase family protein [Bacteroidales bacterium]